MTSFQVVYKIRKLTGESKIGHTGTLDPDAVGVLPICLGKATKLVDFLMDTDKQYRAVMVLGTRTDTQDVSGTVLESMEKSKVLERLTGERGAEEKILSAFEKFQGVIDQLPPMYSAVKVNGVKLVDAARKGKEIERKSRPVTIYNYADINISGLDESCEPVRISFTVDCSKGTYIRTICQDIGSFLNIPACMECLERTRTSGLDLSTALTCEEFEKEYNEGRGEDYIIPTDAFLTKYESITATEDAVKKLIYGNWLKASDFEKIPDGEMDGTVYRVYDSKENFYALYRYSQKDRYYKCEKMFYEINN
ncbi:MAG: tRNA pseudouridine(55) synthase TruB [Lachnospiraceae bacterium]|nr:tRNA pseudouridine(55) synthase TruB [Lachnospiraceae bacterium]